MQPQTLLCFTAPGCDCHRGQTPRRCSWDHCSTSAGWDKSMGTNRGQKRCCDKWTSELIILLWLHWKKTLFFIFFPFFLPPAETAVNIGYSCKLLDADTRLLEWQELRLAMIKNTQAQTHMYTPWHPLIDLLCLPLQTDIPNPRPQGQFLQSQTDGAVGCRQGDGCAEDCCSSHWAWAGKLWPVYQSTIVLLEIVSQKHKPLLLLLMLKYDIGR